MTKYFKQITLLFVLATIAINGLAEALPFNGISTATISDKFSTLFTPAGYVFAIWGVIYVGWLAYAIYPFLTNKHDAQLKAAFPYFIIAAIANMSWLVLWHYELLGWSVVVMLILLINLIQVYRKLEIGTRKVNIQTMLMVNIPMSVYLGWISVATIANVSAFLTQIKWDGLGFAPVAWAIVMLLVATVLGSLMIFMRKDYAYALVLVWAFLGINVSIGNTQPSETLIIILSLGILLIVGLYKQFLYRK